jgi:hypothetical protein
MDQDWSARGRRTSSHQVDADRARRGPSGGGVHTVAFHLRPVFRKLGISSRVELPASQPVRQDDPSPPAPGGAARLRHPSIRGMCRAPRSRDDRDSGRSRRREELHGAVRVHSDVRAATGHAARERPSGGRGCGLRLLGHLRPLLPVVAGPRPAGHARAGRHRGIWPGIRPPTAASARPSAPSRAAWAASQACPSSCVRFRPPPVDEDLDR